jgi:hypothetical protein
LDSGFQIPLFPTAVLTDFSCKGQNDPKSKIQNLKSLPPPGQESVNELANLRMDFRHRPVGMHNLHPARLLAGNGQVTVPNSLVKVHALQFEPLLL